MFPTLYPNDQELITIKLKSGNTNYFLTALSCLLNSSIQYRGRFKEMVTETAEEVIIRIDDRFKDNDKFQSKLKTYFSTGIYQYQYDLEKQQHVIKIAKSEHNLYALNAFTSDLETNSFAVRVLYNINTFLQCYNMDENEYISRFFGVDIVEFDSSDTQSIRNCLEARYDFPVVVSVGGKSKIGFELFEIFEDKKTKQLSCIVSAACDNFIENRFGMKALIPQNLRYNVFILSPELKSVLESHTHIKSHIPDTRRPTYQVFTHAQRAQFFSTKTAHYPPLPTYQVFTHQERAKFFHSASMVVTNDNGQAPNPLQNLPGHK